MHNPLRLPRGTTSERHPSTRHFQHVYFEMCFAPQRRTLFRHLNFQKCSEPFFLSFDFATCFAPQRRALFQHLIVLAVVVVAVAASAAAVIGVVGSTSQLSKVVRAWCFLHFDFNMCFAPQWRAFFRHLPKAVRTCGACNILTLKCASRRNSMHFFNISPATSAPTDSRARYLDVIAFWHGLSQRGATVFSTVSLLFLLDGFVRKQIRRKAECPTFSCFCKHHDTAYSAFQRLLNAYDILCFPKVPEHRRAFSTKMLARFCKHPLCKRVAWMNMFPDNPTYRRESIFCTST